MAQVQALAGEALVCMHYADTNNDGVPEWIALIHRPEPAPYLSGFIWDGETVYPLTPAPPHEPHHPDYGMGQYPTCEIEVRDINANGQVEILIFGHAERNETRLHVFTWDAATDSYRMLGFFNGNAGVKLENLDGDLAEEIVVGYRETRAPTLAWQVVFTWDGDNYGWTADRHAWYYLERPHVAVTHTPEFAVASFYLLLNDRDLPGAYALLSATAQAERPYAEWALGFATTVRVEAGSVQSISAARTETSARVAALVISWDNEAGRVIGRLWDTESNVILTADGWRLTGGTQQLLESWEAQYWE